MKRAVFIDRDGTINEEKEYLYRTDEFAFIPGAPQAIRLLNEAGFLVIVVSNQSGVARGYYTEEDVHLLHRHIAVQLEQFGARVDAWLFCPHHPAGRGSYALPCRCRKPLPGMLLEAAGRSWSAQGMAVKKSSAAAAVSTSSMICCRRLKA